MFFFGMTFLQDIHSFEMKVPLISVELTKSKQEKTILFLLKKCIPATILLFIELKRDKKEMKDVDRNYIIETEAIERES